ncbi:MAG: tetratricopeptide repeat protein [Pseudomonadota bacterium]
MDYFDLGAFTRAVTTSSGQAQMWFSRGLIWLYGYNHEEAVVCFEKAVAADPNCGMAQWGIAYGIGPNYNKPWELFEPEEKKAALDKAHAALEAGKAATGLTPMEMAMIEALATRYPTDPEIEDYGPWNDAFADAMRPVYAEFGEDLEVACIFAEAMMNRTPWQLWNLETGEPADEASTAEAREVLEKAFDSDPQSWNHPGLLHMYIHLMEMSPWPELALRHGDRLVDLVPESGHVVHMATHIDVLCGDYQNVVWRNHRAAAVDRKFTDYAGAQNFYTLYRIHNVHFETYGAMFMGQKSAALAAASELHSLLPREAVAFLPDFFEAFWGMKLHVMVRFGMWQEILDEPFPEDADLFCYTTALMHYGRTVALANTGRIAEAVAEREAFYTAWENVAETRYMFNNPATDVLKVGEKMLLGELAYKAGRIDEGLEHLRAAVKLSDGLLYDEPWGWMQPPRHALAALLLDQDRFEEAEPVYRADLGLDDTLARACQHPRNVWALHGLHECLQRRGETAEILHIRQLLDQAVARSEVPVRSSCYCRTKIAAE